VVKVGTKFEQNRTIRGFYSDLKIENLGSPDISNLNRSGFSQFCSTRGPILHKHVKF